MSRHGLSSYTNHGCRCKVCRDAMAAYRREHRRRVRGKVPVEVPHGLASTAQNYGCRCQPCRDAHNAYLRQWHGRRKEAAEATGP